MGHSHMTTRDYYYDAYRPDPGQLVRINEQPVYVTPPRTSGVAVASLMFGLLGFFAPFLFFPSFIAAVCGHKALRYTKTGEQGGHGIAVAGLILAYTALILMILTAMGYFLLVATGAIG